MSVRTLNLSLALWLVFGAAGDVSAAADSNTPDVFAYISGHWGNSSGHTCVTNPHVISVSEDRSRVTFTYKTPPLESGENRTMPIERQSPEVSATTSIEFQVLDYGDTWVGMRRFGEVELDRLAKPRAWKLMLSRDKMSYRWWLYNSVAGKKSLIRGERCESDEYAKNQAIDKFSLEVVDPVLANLVGTWESDVFEKGRLVRYSAEGTAVLQGAYVHLLIREQSPSPHYEASIYLGRAVGEDEYMGYWMDSFGVESARANGAGSLEGNVLSIRFPSADDSRINVLRFKKGRLLSGDEMELVFGHTDQQNGAIEEDSVYLFKPRK